MKTIYIIRKSFNPSSPVNKHGLRGRKEAIGTKTGKKILKTVQSNRDFLERFAKISSYTHFKLAPLPLKGTLIGMNLKLDSKEKELA